MSRKNDVPYELFEHTADIGLRVFGDNHRELFTNAAKGMFSIIAGVPVNGRTHSGKVFEINAGASNYEELLVDWLSELLTLADIHRVIFNGFNIQLLTNTALAAQATAYPVAEQLPCALEVKAVTYHGLKIITNKDNRLQAEIIFDV